MQEANYSNYLADFGDVSQIPRARLLSEIDKIWEMAGLNNRLPLCEQMESIAFFYSHPVWILNGLFSEYDSASNAHRRAIAECIKNLKGVKIGDYGGGSGVLAKFVAKELPSAEIQIIEPYAAHIFVERLKYLPAVKFIEELGQDYDVVIAQDVLEHIVNPINLAVELIQSTKIGGHVIFANCFYPEIKCHLPATFYLRHTFTHLMKYAGLVLIEPVPGAEHALLFKRITKVNHQALKVADRIAKVIGPMLNWLLSAASSAKRLISAVR